jgi:hypothetical protein
VRPNLRLANVQLGELTRRETAGRYALFQLFVARLLLFDSLLSGLEITRVFILKNPARGFFMFFWEIFGFFVFYIYICPEESRVSDPY